MRRRERRVDLDGDRARLVRYRAEEWGGDEQAPVRFWAAHDAWRAEHPDGDHLLMLDRGPDVPWDPELI